MQKTKQQIEQRKKTFFTRAKSGAFVIGFYVLYALFLFFSDPKWFQPIYGHTEVSFILQMFDLLLLVPIIIFVAKEITNLCFPKHVPIFIYTTCAIFILVFGSGIFLLVNKHFGDLIQWKSRFVLDPFTWYLIICLSGIVFFTFVSTLVWIILSRHFQYVGKKTKVWFPLLTFILNSFFVGFFYITIIHKWTTFMFLILTSTGCDIFAYIGGSLFGKHQMAPRISPKKTWEGVLFGSGVTLLIMCGIFGLFFIPGVETQFHPLYSYLGCQTCEIQKLSNLKPYFWAIYVGVTLLIMFVSVNGDLFFSFIKRRFNIKDFSNLIPGHGGILDRLDALIFTFTFYFLVTVIIQLIMYFAFKQADGLRFLWGLNENFVF